MGFFSIKTAFVNVTNNQIKSTSDNKSKLKLKFKKMQKLTRSCITINYK